MVLFREGIKVAGIAAISTPIVAVISYFLSILRSKKKEKKQNKK